MSELDLLSQLSALIRMFSIPDGQGTSWSQFWQQSPLMKHSKTLNNEKKLIDLLINDISEKVIDQLVVKFNDL